MNNLAEKEKQLINTKYKEDSKKLDSQLDQLRKKHKSLENQFHDIADLYSKMNREIQEIQMEYAKEESVEDLQELGECSDRALEAYKKSKRIVEDELDDVEHAIKTTKLEQQNIEDDYQSKLSSLRKEEELCH